MLRQGKHHRDGVKLRQQNDAVRIARSNHVSFIDSFFLPLMVPRQVTYVAKAEYFDDWKTAWFFRACGQIPIERGPVVEAR